MKKLELTKETLASLQDADSQKVAAGMPPTLCDAGCTIDYCYTDNCYARRLACKG